MARLIKNIQKATLGIRLTTIFSDKATERNFKVGDIIEGLRFVKDGEIEIVSGRIVDIKYTMAARLTWNKRLPKDTLATDMIINTLVIDASENYRSNIIDVPVREIVEFEDETNVIRMKYEPFIVYDMEMKYSDLAIKKVSIEVGDIFDEVRIMDIANIGTDITGKFRVISFGYVVSAGKLIINSVAFENVETGEKIVANMEYILALNEVYTYELSEEGSITEIVSGLADGDTLTITNAINTAGTPLTITKKNVEISLAANITADGSTNSGIQVYGGSATVYGDGIIVNNTPYDREHASGIVSVRNGGELTFEGSGISAVIEDDPADKGQFGITLFQDSKVTINDGTFTAGWYCVCGNGSGTTADSVVEINGGELVSVADYAIYHPQPGKLIINGGIIKGAAGAIAANNGTIEINGGEFFVLGDGDTGEWSDGTSGLTDVAINLNARYGDIVCRITDGIFHATAAGTIMIKTGTAHNVDLQISGGLFTEKPNEEWIAPGYTCSDIPDPDGFYHVEKAV